MCVLKIRFNEFFISIPLVLERPWEAFVAKNEKLAWLKIALAPRRGTFSTLRLP
jgi:hypothetical protein